MQPLLSLREISKKYPGVQALDCINLDFFEGEVHAIVGENGAGKSTLIKIITGAIQADEGTLEIGNATYTTYSPHDALYSIGIAAIYQEFNLVTSLSITDNIFLGKEIRKGPLLEYQKMNQSSHEILSRLGFQLEPTTVICDLSVAEQQIVEIGKALSHDVRLLIMDEPTAPLTPTEVSRLFELINTLKNNGVTVIYISHRLEEALTISDRITVLRDGQLIQTLNAARTDRKELISLMVGRKLGQEYPSREKSVGDTILQVERLSTRSIEDVSFELRAGEILGIAGLVGSGRTEIARALFGLDKIQKGKVKIRGENVSIGNPTEAMEKGLGLVPEDRKKSGILGKLSVRHNISFSVANRIASWLIINQHTEDKIVADYVNRLSIRTTDENQLVQYLSGGNQQKVVLSRLLARDCDILLFDEPTRGVDVGAKREIYYLLDELARSGKGILMISSDLPELISMANRIMVMNSGRVQGFIDREKARQDLIIDMASN
ncbi:MAG: sugar ABC transporter ATP-binding protein [Anaerolineales bacterium]|nr:sugar ABC transporter ATP-binding protein [Anaerolineales bacterium]